MSGCTFVYGVQPAVIVWGKVVVPEKRWGCECPKCGPLWKASNVDSQPKEER